MSAAIAFAVSQPYAAFATYSLVSAYLRSHFWMGFGPNRLVSVQSARAFDANGKSYHGFCARKSTYSRATRAHGGVIGCGALHEKVLQLRLQRAATGGCSRLQAIHRGNTDFPDQQAALGDECGVVLDVLHDMRRPQNARSAITGSAPDRDASRRWRPEQIQSRSHSQNCAATIEHRGVAERSHVRDEEYPHRVVQPKKNGHEGKETRKKEPEKNPRGRSPGEKEIDASCERKERRTENAKDPNANFPIDRTEVRILRQPFAKERPVNGCDAEVIRNRRPREDQRCGSEEEAKAARAGESDSCA